MVSWAGPGPSSAAAGPIHFPDPAIWRVAILRNLAGAASADVGGERRGGENGICVIRACIWNGMEGEVEGEGEGEGEVGGWRED